MATTPSLKVTKSMAFKGGTKLWSNRYHFNGGTPANGTQWTALSDAVVTAEKACLTPSVTIVSTTGYAAGSDVPVFSKTYSTAGTFAGSGQLPPGEAAALLRYSTTARTSKNHPIYLFNYMHAPICSTSTNHQDELTSGQKTAYDTYAAAWISGFSDGVHTCVRAGPNGATATGHFTEEYVTHRDFPYSRSA
jgi:hypothetical protein